ncbi:MAG TPA: STING domain-containing protein [Mucilaginibacter sp.]|nr:STING domain-containing protein [Mucilaginibacter sp.]
MKLKDLLKLIAFVFPIITSTAPVVYHWFWELKTPAAEDFWKFILVSIIGLIVNIVLILYCLSLARKIGKADGLAFGYFYNFIYETVMFLHLEGEIDLRDENGKVAAPPIQDVSILIIVPDDLHAYYLISNVVRSLFEEVDIFPAEKIRSRKKVWRLIKTINKTILIDVPPTTLRTIRLYKESIRELDHYSHWDQLDQSKKALFEKIKHSSKSDIKMFTDSLKDILDEESVLKNMPEFNKIVYVRKTSELISKIFSPEQLKEIGRLSHNENETYRKHHILIDKLIGQNKHEIIQKIIAVISTVQKPTGNDNLFKKIYRFFLKLNPFLKA